MIHQMLFHCLDLFHGDVVCQCDLLVAQECERVVIVLAPTFIVGLVFHVDVHDCDIGSIATGFSNSPIDGGNIPFILS